MTATRPDTTTARGAPELVSVVLPVRNGEATIREQLAALAAQVYDGAWEVVVVDDGCRDGTVAVVESWQPRLPALRVVRVERSSGLNRARNVGAAAAAGDFLVYCDADDVVAPGWLAAFAAAAPGADLLGGRLDWETLADGTPEAWEQFEPMSDLHRAYGFLPVVSGGNCGVWADVARAVRWDESFRFAASDIEFSWRVHFAGYTLGFAPAAVLCLRRRGRLRGLARQYFRYGTGEPLLYRRFRGIGMPASGWDEGLAKLRWLAARRDLLRDERTRGGWVRVAAHLSGRACGSLRRGVVFL